jgi:phospho-N-acetylmuramoyl-pentapeptide-transferase
METSGMIGTVVGSFLVTMIVMPFIIRYFRKKKQGQAIRDEGPKWHNSKAGTPTMGGVGFLLVATVVSLIAAACLHLLNPSLLILLFILVLYGILGFLDDFIKLMKKQNEGLTSLQKLVGQIVGGIIFYLVYQHEGYSTSLNFFGLDLPLGLIYAIFAIIWLVGFSNAVNLTDGLDGLVGGLGTISYATYALIAYHQGQYEVLIVCLAIIGGLVGFLPYNRKPAKIFMGDVGSLALGGLLAAISIMLHQEWTLLLIGIVYVCETASVMIQVTSFKLTGKRVFKMSPIHHHFEMMGWSEWKVDIVFWIIGLIGAGITLAIVL